MSQFDPARDIPDLSGRVILVTGGSSGLGEATAKALAQHGPARLYLGSRSPARGEAAAARIRAASPAASKADIRILEVDLASSRLSRRQRRGSTPRSNGWTWCISAAAWP